MRWFLVLLPFLVLPALAAEDPFRPEWAATCKFGDTEFIVGFKSRSGHAEQDDQVATLVWGRNKAIVLPVEQALFEPGRFVSNAQNHCRDIGAFDWPEGKLLLLIPQNSRPFSHRLVALVFDPRAGRFVHGGGDIGAIWREDVVLLRKGNGFRALLERSWHVDAAGHGEFATPDWMLLDGQGGRFVHRWETLRKQSH
jgi:hypothetical protein